MGRINLLKFRDGRPKPLLRSSGAGMQRHWGPRLVKPASVTSPRAAAREDEGGVDDGQQAGGGPSTSASVGPPGGRRNGTPPLLAPRVRRRGAASTATAATAAAVAYSTQDEPSIPPRFDDEYHRPRYQHGVPGAAEEDGPGCAPGTPQMRAEGMIQVAVFDDEGLKFPGEVLIFDDPGDQGSPRFVF